MAKQKVNPWAICHAQLGKEKTDKFERCVMKIKAKHGLKEDAEYIDWFLKEAVNEGGEERIKRQMGAVKQTHSDWDRMQGKLGYKRQQRKLRTAAGTERGVAQRRPDLAAKHTEPGGAPRPKGGAYTGPAAELRQAHASRQFTSGMKAHGSAATAASAAKKAVKRKDARLSAEWGHRRKALKTQRGERASRQRRLGGMGDHTEYEGPSLSETAAYIAESDWIQGAVDPAHKGYCTPMTKETCTPARKALAKRFKKAGRREGTKKGGKTGWKGKV